MISVALGGLQAWCHVSFLKRGIMMMSRDATSFSQSSLSRSMSTFKTYSTLLLFLYFRLLLLTCLVSKLFCWILSRHILAKRFAQQISCQNLLIVKRVYHCRAVCKLSEDFRANWGDIAVNQTSLKWGNEWNSLKWWVSFPLSLLIKSFVKN